MVTADDHGSKRLASMLSGRGARLALIPLLTVLAIALFMAVASIVGTRMGKPTGNHMLPAVELEVAKIAPPGVATLIAPVSKVTQMSFADVGVSYPSRLPYDALRAHYD